MSVPVADALSAYNRAAAQVGERATPAHEPAAGGDFGALLRSAAEGTLETLDASEAASRQAAVGKADLNDVVLAVSQAELTLQTVVSIRDRAVQAYQEIMRMPI